MDKKCHIFKSNVSYLLTLLSLFLIMACEEKPKEGMLVLHEKVIVTQGTEATAMDNLSRLVALNPEALDQDPVLLTEDFYEVQSLEVSYDSKNLLFAAKRTVQEPWQIWELDLKTREARPVTHSDSDCQSPAYLPGGRLVYSRLVQDKGEADYHVLETAFLDGKEVQQITFGPVDYRSIGVLKDGRILAICNEVYPVKKEPFLVVMRPDGTKIELFYKGSQIPAISSQAIETESGEVLFVTFDPKLRGSGKLMGVDYNNPMRGRREIQAGLSGDISAIGSDFSGQIWTCFKSDADQSNVLYALRPNPRSDDSILKMERVYQSKGYDITQVAGIQKRDRPRKLPSAVNLEVETALLMCQNINDKGLFNPDPEAEIQQEAVKLEVMGIEGLLGTVNIEQDGSFYIKIKADTPFKLQTKDIEGNLVSGPGTWMNLRPNERRACVGCHTGQNRVPENVQPLAVKKEPIEIPQFNQSIMANSMD